MSWMSDTAWWYVTYMQFGATAGTAIGLTREDVPTEFRILFGILFVLNAFVLGWRSKGYQHRGAK